MIFDGISFFIDNNIPYNQISTNISQGWVGLRCPFCPDTSDHLGFNLQSGAFSCWHCGAHSPLETIEALLHVSRSEAMGVFKKYLTTGISFYKEKKRASASKVELPPQKFTPVEQKYLEKRNLTDHHVSYYDIRGGGLFGKWAYRIVFPIYYNGMIVSATGRIIADVEPKYYTLPPKDEVVHHKDIFFGLDYVPGRAAAIVEGPLDAIRGGPGFIASFGVNLTDEQLVLCTFFDTVYFVRDSDDAGEHSTEQAYRLASLYGDKISIEVISLDNGYKDVGAMPDPAIVEMRAQLWGLV